MAVRWGVLTLAILVIAIQLCSTDAAGAKPKPGAKLQDTHRKPVGKPAEGGKPGKTVRSYQKLFDQPCTKSTDCNLYKLLDCHTRATPKVCVCMYRMHEWDAAKGCHDPSEVPNEGAPEVEPTEPEPEGDPVDDPLAPAPDEEETPEEAKKRMKWVRIKKTYATKQKRNFKPNVQPANKPKPKPKGK